MYSKKESIAAILISGIIAFLYIMGIPSVFFIKVQLADVDPVCITLLVNIILVIALGIALVKAVISKWELGFRTLGFADGMKEYGISCIIGTLIPLVAFGIGLYPFDYTPTLWKILIEGIAYYIGVGFIEEFFCRGLLQNGLEQLWDGKKAVIITALIFGTGHIFGMIGMPFLLILCKLVWTVGLGLYLGTVYYKTRNLLLVSVFHFVIDFCGLPFCFSTQRLYPTMSAVVIMIAFGLLGMCSIRILGCEA